MPYIITTKRPGKYGPGHYAHEADVRSRRAVATLEETRKVVAGFVPEEIALDCWASFSITESGGTVGPLPDGTVVEIEATTWLDLYKHAEGDHGEDFVYVFDHIARARIIDAFNARES